MFYNNTSSAFGIFDDRTFVRQLKTEMRFCPTFRYEHDGAGFQLSGKDVQSAYSFSGVRWYPGDGANVLVNERSFLSANSRLRGAYSSNRNQLSIHQRDECSNGHRVIAYYILSQYQAQSFEKLFCSLNSIEHEVSTALNN